MIGNYIPIILIFGSEFFFSISAIIGYEYLGSASSSIYIIYNISIFLILMGISLFTLLNKGTKFTSEQFFWLLYPFIIIAIFLYSKLFNKINNLGAMRFVYFILWGMPSIYIGIYMSKKSIINNIGKIAEILMLIFSFATIISTIDAIKNGATVNIGGASYQGASYIAGFAFGLNLYYMFYGKNHERFKFTNYKAYKILCIFLFIFQVVGVLTSGGRGGMILIFAYIVYITSSVIYNRKKDELYKYAILVTSIVIFISLILPKLLEIPLFKDSMSRVFSYISMDGINWSGTSERDVVYKNAIQLILNSPINGYGMFGMWKVSKIYPHNILLEILLQGGIIYLSFFIIMIVLLIRKYLYFIKNEYQNRIIIIFLLYPLVMLMFSGTYLNNALCWFCISYIYCYKIDRKHQNLKNI